MYMCICTLYTPTRYMHAFVLAPAKIYCSQLKTQTRYKHTRYKHYLTENLKESQGQLKTRNL